MVVNDRAGDGPDHGSACLAVVMVVTMSIVMMIGLRKRACGRQKEREAQQRGLDFSGSHLCTSDLL
jgi:hypothetical protein